MTMFLLGLGTGVVLGIIGAFLYIVILYRLGP